MELPHVGIVFCQVGFKPLSHHNVDLKGLCE